MPEDTMKISSEKQDGATIVSQEGDIDLGRSPTLRTSLREAQSSKPQRLVVDLSRVDYMDSSGVATLVEALQNARRGGTKLVLCCMKDRVRSIFEIARLDTVFAIVETREAAITA